jgi:glycosyltransferase involved in cell wall biosynthesis
MSGSPTFLPTCSVVVCTRNRPDALDRCLVALGQLAYPRFEVLVVDNVPGDARAMDVARRRGARYLVEPVSGLSRARNTGARACTSDVIAFTDDDAVPEPRWLSCLTAPFCDASIAAVTGRTLPLDDAGAPIARDVTDLGPDPIRVDLRHALWFEIASFGGVGNGNNMAFRRRLFDGWRGFDERLGRGAPLSSGEEHRAFAELIEDGHAVAYAPDARVWHPVPATSEERHREYLRSRSDLAAYAVFLFLVTRHKRKVAKYVMEAVAGTRRPWRFHTEPAPPAVARWRVAQAYVSGALRGLRTSMRSARPTRDYKSQGTRHKAQGVSAFRRTWRQSG